MGVALHRTGQIRHHTHTRASMHTCSKPEEIERFSDSREPAVPQQVYLHPHRMLHKRGRDERKGRRGREGERRREEEEEEEEEEEVPHLATSREVNIFLTFFKFSFFL